MQLPWAVSTRAKAQSSTIHNLPTECCWILTGDEVSPPACSNVRTSHFIIVQIMVCFVLGDIWLLRPINAFPGGWMLYVRPCIPSDLRGIIKENQKSVYFPKRSVKVCNCFHLFYIFLLHLLSTINCDGLLSAKVEGICFIFKVFYFLSSIGAGNQVGLLWNVFPDGIHCLWAPHETSGLEEWRIPKYRS